MRLPRLLLLALLILTVVAVGCGDDEGSSGSGGDQAAATATTPETPQPTETETVETEAETETEAATPDLEDTSVKPQIRKPTGSPASKLVKEDIVVGKGKAAKAGDTVTVQYVGVSFSNGEEFDASWDRGQAFTFPLGAQQVIPGWDKGLVGMKVGGRRQLTIPPEMAYGAEGSPPSIGPNETLVFVVDLEKID
jgi:peptidylprolyl isomerase